MFRCAFCLCVNASLCLYVFASMHQSFNMLFQASKKLPPPNPKIQGREPGFVLPPQFVHFSRNVPHQVRAMQRGRFFCILPCANRTQPQSCLSNRHVSCRHPVSVTGEPVVAWKSACWANIADALGALNREDLLVRSSKAIFDTDFLTRFHQPGSLCKSSVCTFLFGAFTVFVAGFMHKPVRAEFGIRVGLRPTA